MDAKLLDAKPAAESKAVNVVLDSSELEAAIEELTRFWETIFQFPPSLINRAVEFIHGGAEIFRIDWATAEGTCLCRFKPSDRFADLLVALLGMGTRWARCRR